MGDIKKLRANGFDRSKLIQLYQTEGLTSGTDELNDKQGKKSQNGCATTWGPNNGGPPDLNLQLIKEFRDLTISTSLKFNKMRKK